MNIIVHSINSLLKSIQATNAYNSDCLTFLYKRIYCLKKNNILGFLVFDSKR